MLTLIMVATEQAGDIGGRLGHGAWELAFWVTGSEGHYVDRSSVIDQVLSKVVSVSTMVGKWEDKCNRTQYHCKM